MLDIFRPVCLTPRIIIGENSPDWALIREGWFYEPSVAEHVFERMLAAKTEQLTYLRGHHLVDSTTEGDQIKSVNLEMPRQTNLEISAQTFIDATYEGHFTYHYTARLASIRPEH